jgi:ribosome-binding protein aMBF1 (putative translation factor)
MTTLAHIIQAKREQLGWSVWKLGKETSLGITHIKRIEDGKECHFTTALTLLQALGVKSIKIQDIDLSR